jgi:O-antigen ligase
MYNPRRRVAVVSIIVVVAAAIAIFVYYDWDALSAPFNRPDAFTGRVQIWKVLVEYHSDHPLGSGYGSFWNIGPDRQMLHYVKSTNWVAGQPQAHNGYLDLLVQLGMPGLILGILAFIVAPIGRLLVSLEARRAQGGMLLAMIIFSAGHNFTESSYLDRDQLVEVFCLLAIALVGVIARPNRAKRAARLIP